MVFDGGDVDPRVPEDIERSRWDGYLDALAAEAEDAEVFFAVRFEMAESAWADHIRFTSKEVTV